MSDRAQRVTINGQYSEWKHITSGVPQGSVLGPLLFILYINDLTSNINHSKIRLFADDTCLFLEVDDRDESANLIESDLSQIETWANRW